jgi:uncharacterized protein
VTSGDSPRLRLKLWPLLVVVLLGVGLPYLAAYLAVFASRLWHTPSPHGPTLPWLYMQHGLQFLLALLAWGVVFGVLMTLVDYAPQLIAHSKPDLGFALTRGHILGWLFFEGVYVGPTEEVPFRALLVTFLAATMPGRLRLGRFEMNWAGVIVALIFALLHATNFSLRAWPIALGQQLYAFVLGVLYAYWLEKSGSVVAPIIGHNVSDGIEYLIVFCWLLVF